MLSRAFAAIAIGLIRFYRLTLGAILPPACRFEPSCSRYSEEAVRRYGVLHGVLKTSIRLAKCHPFHPGGLDPVE